MGTSRNQFQKMLNTQNYKVQWAWLPWVKRKNLSLYFVILFHIFKDICTSVLNSLLWAWPLVLVLQYNWPAVAVSCMTQNEERSLPCKVHMIKISLDVSDNAFFFIINITFILTEQKETFKETSHLICISALKREKRYSENFQSFKWEVPYLR